MKVYELQPFLDLDSVQLTERPTPTTLGPHEVRVGVHAVSLNYRDLVLARGASKRAKPVVPTSDGAGEVIAVGEAVTRVKVGDRVAANFFPTWQAGRFGEQHHANALGGSIDGMLAEEVTLAESAWVKIPRGWSFEQAATLPCAGLTAWHALFEAGPFKSGDTVLVQGTGGVSIFALQLARAAGATVLATSSSADKRARLTEMGATATFDYRAQPQWGEAVKAATGGVGVDRVIEVGGAGTFDQSAKALRFEGDLALIGVLAGTKAAIETYPLIHKAAHVHGIYVGSVAMFEAFVRALESSEIEPVIDRVFPFAEARAAYHYLASGAHFGKVVVRVV